MGRFLFYLLILCPCSCKHRENHVIVSTSNLQGSWSLGCQPTLIVNMFLTITERLEFTENHFKKLEMYYKDMQCTQPLMTRETSGTYHTSVNKQPHITNMDFKIENFKVEVQDTSTQAELAKEGESHPNPSPIVGSTLYGTFRIFEGDLILGKNSLENAERPSFTEELSYSRSTQKSLQ